MKWFSRRRVVVLAVAVIGVLGVWTWMTITALPRAVLFGNAARTEQLLLQGASPCRRLFPWPDRYDQPQNAMSIAVRYNRPEIVRILAAHGARRCEKPDRPYLFWALFFNHPKCVIELIHAGADPNALVNHNLTALEYALDNEGKYECVLALLDHGANPNVTPAYARLIVGLACGTFAGTQHRFDGVAIALLNAGVPVDTELGERDGRTFAMFIAQYGSRPVIEQMLLRSPDMELSDDDGRTLGDYLRDSGG